MIGIEALINRVWFMNILQSVRTSKSLIIQTRGWSKSDKSISYVLLYKLELGILLGFAEFMVLLFCTFILTSSFDIGEKAKSCSSCKT